AGHSVDKCYYNRSPKVGGVDLMLFLAAALLLFGLVLGTVAHAPLGLSAVAAVVIVVWLGVFALRERHRRRGSSAH
ncbi:hypothetical protein NGM37_38875, partial [Streptomyces sp. TRM76130]|nr:hypothetical protein [Streptomyces sp. TRM76130]